MSDGNKYILLTVFNHLDSFRDALHFIVLQISQILVSMEGAAKKGGGEIKAKKHCSDKLGTFTDDGQMNDRNVLYKNNNKRTYSVRVLCSCGLDWIATG